MHRCEVCAIDPDQGVCVTCGYDHAEEAARRLAAELKAASVNVTTVARGSDGLWRVWVGYFVGRTSRTEPIILHADGGGADVAVARDFEKLRAVVDKVFPPAPAPPPPPPTELPLPGAPDVVYLVDLEGMARGAAAIAQVRALGAGGTTPEEIARVAARAVWGRMVDLLAEQEPAFLAVAANEGAGWRRVTQPQKKGGHHHHGGDGGTVDRVIEIAIDLCFAHAIPVWHDEDDEGIDLLATAAQRLIRAGLRVVLVTQAKVLYQLVGERLTVWHGPGSYPAIGPAEVVADREHFGGVEPARVRDVLALSTSVSGLGPMKAAELLAGGTVEDLLARRAALPHGPREKLYLHASALADGLRAATLNLEARLVDGVDLGAMRVGWPVPSPIRHLLRERGMPRLAEQVRDFPKTPIPPEVLARVGPKGLL